MCDWTGSLVCMDRYVGGSIVCVLVIWVGGSFFFGCICMNGCMSEWVLGNVGVFANGFFFLFKSVIDYLLVISRTMLSLPVALPTL